MLPAAHAVVSAGPAVLLHIAEGLAFKAPQGLQGEPPDGEDTMGQGTRGGAHRKSP